MPAVLVQDVWTCRLSLYVGSSGPAGPVRQGEELDLAPGVDEAVVPAGGGDQAVLGQDTDPLLGLAEELRDLGGGEPSVVSWRLHGKIVAISVRYVLELGTSGAPVDSGPDHLIALRRGPRPP